MDVTDSDGRPRVLDQLSAVVVDLDRYIDRRAAEIAAPRVTAARNRAEQEITAARAEVTRREDLVADLWRRVRVLEMQVDRWREATGVQYPHEARRAAARPMAPSDGFEAVLSRVREDGTAG